MCEKTNHETNAMLTVIWFFAGYARFNMNVSEMKIS